MNTDPRLSRLDPNRLTLQDNNLKIPVTLFANEQVPVDSRSVTELLRLLELKNTVDLFADSVPHAFITEPTIRQVAVTPDFHKAKGIPVGTVLVTEGFFVPQAIGNDINCGMRLHRTSLTADQIFSNIDKLETAFRHLFFEGGRNIPMTGIQREAIFRAGLLGLLDSTPKTLTEGLWKFFHELDMESDLDNIEQQGSLVSDSVFGLKDFIGDSKRLSRDSQIGSIGGGNHFVEIQYIKNILDGTIAHAWGLKPGMVTVMVHTGSVSIGHLCGVTYRDVVRQIWPKKLKYPDNGIFILPTGERYQDEVTRFWDSMNNAANFAFANRMFLALMALKGLNQVCGESDFSLLYDAPHNLLWKEPSAEGISYVHRKGACPARGFEAMEGTSFAYYGEPVLVPGSMGASSFILAGQGNPDSAFSASHGAGRVLSRGKALRGHDEAFKIFMEKFRVITPVDLRRQEILLRRDIVAKKLADIKQEAPYAYKGIGPVIKTLNDADIARPVAELTPLMTIKG